MKPEQLKLYHKYRNINNSDKELIYIGIDNENEYWFLYKTEKYTSSLSLLIDNGLNPDKIVTDLNLETLINRYGEKSIKGYGWYAYSKENVETSIQPILKDKIKK
jgi:hypothetical protein